MSQAIDPARSGSTAQPEGAQNIEDIYPLSPIQQGMLFHSLHDPLSYFVQIQLTIDELLDLDAFKQSWQEVVQRHPVLRTLFVWERREKPLQVVVRQATLPWDELDWRGLSREQQREQLDGYLHADQQRGFDLARAPLMRVAVIRMDEQRYTCVWSRHHIISDALSTAQVLRDVFALYEARRNNQPVSLPPTRPFRDYIRWLQSQDLQQAEAFWRENLAGITRPVALGVDQAPGSPPSEHPSYAEQHVRVAADSTEALSAFARRHQLTLNTLVQGAWAMLLSRYSGADDVLFGATIAVRPASLEGVETIVGPLINTLPLRVRLSPEDRLVPWLQQIQRQQAEILHYGYSPLLEIQGWSSVPRGTPLFESIVAFHNNLTPSTVHGRERALQIDEMLNPELTNYPLNVEVYHGAELVFSLTYDRDRFSDDAIAQMLGHLHTILSGFLADPAQRLLDLPLLTPSDTDRILRQWNNTAVEYPHTATLHQLFEDQARRIPDAVAVVYDEQQISYAELDRRANQLAHYLQRLGVGPDVRVGISLERSIEMVVGLMGIAKAGGCYVPLDPTYPQERLQFMLEDAQVRVLLTQQRLLRGFPAHEAHSICLDSDWATIAQEPETAPPCAATADNLIYVIYTSGSTGRPKGVMLNHQGRVNNFTDFNRRFQIGPGDRLLALSSLSFDMCAYDVFGVLAAGAAIVLPPAMYERDPRVWADLIVRERVTLWHSVPALLVMLVETVAGQPELYPRSLRVVLLGGDWIPVSLPDRVKAMADRVQVISLGGATEVSMDSTIYEIQHSDPAWPSIPYGVPMANQRAYVLDAHLRPVPVGVPGELYLGGIGLAWGYNGRPELTAEKFLPMPGSDEPGARIYRTGDLARWMPDGNLELLGRIDQQVKIRGLRIELGEITAALRQHPQIHDAVVISRADKAGDPALVAYCIPQGNATPTSDELRSYLKGSLPHYMIPSAFVALESFPLTPNGKLDRKALPEPTLQQTKRIDIRMRTYLEAELAAIWTHTLKLDHLGIHDNFFELGGHSLKALGLLSRIREATGVHVPLSALFDSPTVASLAAWMSEAVPTPAQQVLRVQKGQPGRPAVFLVPPIDGYAMDMWYVGSALGSANPVYAFQGPGLDHEMPFFERIEEMAEYFVRHMREIQPQGPYMMVGKSSGGVVALEMAHQLEQVGETGVVGLLDSSPPNYFGWRMEPRRWGRREAVVFLVHVWFEGVDLDDVLQMSDSEILPFYFKLSQEAGIVPETWQLADFEHWVDYNVVHGHALAAYSSHAAVIDAPIYMFVATDENHDDDNINLDDWAAYTKGGLRKIDVPGTHATMNDPPHVFELGKAIAEAFKLG
jgi:surfactin family lipopeptide synthetase C